MAKQCAVVFVVGHSGLSAGASGQGIPEAYFWARWVPSIARACRAREIKAKVRHRWEEAGSWTDRQTALYEHLNTLNADLLVDVHFNGGTKGGSVGLFRPGHARSEQAAVSISAAIAAAQGTRSLRCYDSAGADGVPRSWTGKETESADGKWYPAGSELVLLSRTEPAAAVVLEPFEGSVASDYAAGLAALKSGATQAAIADAVADLLVEWG